MADAVAITGATGFAGGHVVPLLRSLGGGVRALVRKGAKPPEGAEVVEGDLGDEAALQRLCAGASAVVHLAGAVSAPNREAFFAVNEAGTRRLAAAAVRAGVPRFIHISSLAARAPQLSHYAASKRAGEEAVQAQAASFRLAVLRPPAVYGAGDRATLPLMAQLTRRIAIVPGPRDQRFSLLHATDLARFIASLLDSDWSGVAEIDDGTAGGYGWADLARTAGLAEQHAVTPLFLPRAVVAGLAATRAIAGLTAGKAREFYHPDWVARGPQPALGERIGFDQGFRATVAWYRERGWLPPARRIDKQRVFGKGMTAS